MLDSGKISELQNVWRDSFEESYPVFCLISKFLKYIVRKAARCELFRIITKRHLRSYDRH